MTTVIVDRAQITVDALPLLGQGGEADVYDLGDGRALKLYKGPTHADVRGDPAREAVATARLAEAEAKLGKFPSSLPPAFVAPTALARAARGRAVVGYVMPKVAGVPMFTLGEPRHRRGTAIDLDRLVAAFGALHAAVTAAHALGVVIGDFNDGNVLVDGARCHLIDADSLQYGAWRCDVFTDRYVDPRLCDRTAPAPVLTAPHDRDSDWYAFTVMLFRALAWTGPFGGVHQPRDPAARIAPAARPLRGPSVFDADVVYPKAAAPLAGLPAPLAAHFRQVFDRGQRGPFPRALLDGLRLVRCATCAIDYGARRCPCCQHAAAAVVLTGTVTVRAVDPRSLARTVWPVSAAVAVGAPAVWLAGGTLFRRGTLGPEPVGQVLAGATHAWVGLSLGAGYWRAGGYAVAFTFAPGRRGLDDRARLPPFQGRVVAHGCALTEDRAWLWWREAIGAGERLRLVCVSGGAVTGLVETTVADADWMLGLAGAVAAGPYLFVPTDAGVVRVEIDGGTPRVTRRFPETAALCTAADDLLVTRDGLTVRKAGAPISLATGPARAVALTLSARVAG
ncbi:MAG: hypothetical protein R3B06_14045 [Kofleriaceae bacterium]